MGNKLLLVNLRTPSYIYYVKKLEGKFLKLVGDKATKCRLLSYKGSTIYYVLTLDNKVIRSSNVKFYKLPFL